MSAEADRLHRRRAAMRSSVICDRGLGGWSKLIYFGLDHFANWQGLAYPKQVTLGSLVGASLSEVQRSLPVLVERKYISVVRRRQRFAVYLLAWNFSTDTSPVGYQNIVIPQTIACDTPPVRYHGSRSLYEHVAEPVASQPATQNPVSEHLGLQVRWMQEAYPGSEFSQSVVPQSLLSRIADVGGLQTVADVQQFGQFVASRFKGQDGGKARQPGFQGGPRTPALLVHWARDFREILNSYQERQRA